MASLSDTLGLRRPRRQIVDLDVTEVSGVDDPANLSPGWVVMKSTSDVNPDVFTLMEILKAEKEAIKKDQDLLAALTGADLSDAPPEVQQAASILADFLGQQYGTGAANSPASTPALAGPGAGAPQAGPPPGAPQPMGKAKVNPDVDQDDDDDSGDGDDDADDTVSKAWTPKRMVNAMLDLFGIAKTQKEILDSYTDTSNPPASGDGSNKGYDEQDSPDADAIMNKVLGKAYADFQERLKKVMALKRAGKEYSVVKAVDEMVDWLGGLYYEELNKAKGQTYSKGASATKSPKDVKLPEKSAGVPTPPNFRNK